MEAAVSCPFLNLAEKYRGTVANADKALNPTQIHSTSWKPNQSEQAPNTKRNIAKPKSEMVTMITCIFLFSPHEAHLSSIGGLKTMQGI